MVKEFRDFVMRGNVLDLAVAVVMGAAFTAIINSLVNDILMPIIGVVIGGVDFSALSVAVGTAVITYGKFLQALVNFLLVALALFLVIKAINQAQRKFAPPAEPAPAESPAPPQDVQLLQEIRDLLKEQRR
jgi:large conductance mechanosensitive channel